MVQDMFYDTEGITPETIREIFTWADGNGLKTEVTMLNADVSFARGRSDKDFYTVLGLIDESAARFFVFILRKHMNLYLILTDNAVIDDVIEIGIRNINVGPNEYFISVLVDKEHLNYLVDKYELVPMK